MLVNRVAVSLTKGWPAVGAALLSGSATIRLISVLGPSDKSVDEQHSASTTSPKKKVWPWFVPLQLIIQERVSVGASTIRPRNVNLSEAQTCSLSAALTAGTTLKLMAVVHTLNKHDYCGRQRTQSRRAHVAGQRLRLRTLGHSRRLEDRGAKGHPRPLSTCEMMSWTRER
jgi:hypothetical protein